MGLGSSGTWKRRQLPSQTTARTCTRRAPIATHAQSDHQPHPDRSTAKPPRTLTAAAACIRQVASTVEQIRTISAMPATNQATPETAAFSGHVLGVIGGSSLFHAKEFSATLRETVIETEYGGVVAHVGTWKHWDLQIVFVQRHHADTDGEYKQPRQINYRAIAAALRVAKCEAVLGIYSVGSMTKQIDVGRLVVPEDYFNPFDILHMSRHYDAHVVPDMTKELRERLLQVLKDAEFDPYDGGVYIQTAGPRFETKAEVRFFKQFGELIGMTGANEAELINELRVPFAMFGIVDNLANGIGEQLTLEAFKIAQKNNSDTMEKAMVTVLNDLAEHRFLAQLPQRSSE